MEEIQWRELVEATRKGDKQAFEKLYRGTERAVYFTCLKLLANEDSAKDIMQDTFMTALNKLDSLDDGAKFPMWINRIAVNKCKDSFKKVTNDSIDEQMEQGADFRDDDKFIPEEYVTDETKRQIILRIINEELSEVQRQTIILYYYDEMPLEEISEVMDCPVKTVSSRLCSARDKIKGAVLIYERENDDRLHALVPVPILTKILRMEAQSILVPDISQILLQANIFGAATASASSITTSTIAGGSKMLTGKAIAAITAVIIAAGGATAVVLKNKGTEEAPSTSVSVAAEESKAETTAAAGETETEAPVTEEKSEESTEESVADEVSEYEVTTKKSEDYFDWFGINMYRPAEYNVDRSSGHPECWLDDHSGSLTYYTYHDSEIDSVTPESFMENVYNGVEITYLTKIEMKYGHIHDNQIESEEKVQVNGHDFIRQQGVYTLSDSSEDRKVAYVAYFGTLEFENFGKQPVAWIAMSHSEDAAKRAEVLKVADIAAENCKPIEE